MSNVPKSKQKPSTFNVVDLAGRIYDRTLDICLRMPKRYTYLVLLPILNLAGEVADYTKEGNSTIPSLKDPNPDDVRLRRIYFMKAKASLQALIQRMRFFLDRPDVCRHEVGGRIVGITESELKELAKNMGEEAKLIKGILDKDEKRYKF